MDVDEVADELYALAPRDFVAARDARSKEAKAAGDPEAAKQIAALRKPTVVAWVANLLVRRRADDVEPLLELGDALREATATLSGPQLRELSRQRHQVIAALVQHARTLAQDEGQRVTEDVARGLEETLAAALADPAAGELLRQGRLTDALHHSGFGGDVFEAPDTPAGPRGRRDSATTSRTATARQRLAADAPPAAGEKGGGKPPAATTKKAAADERRRAERRARLERDLAEAWSAARAAADARDDAGAAKDAAEAAVRDARAASDDAKHEVDRLRTELRAAEGGLEPARAAEKEARAADAQARQDLRAAEREAERTRRHVSELQGDLDGL